MVSGGQKTGDEQCPRCIVMKPDRVTIKILFLHSYRSPMALFFSRLFSLFDRRSWACPRGSDQISWLLFESEQKLVFVLRLDYRWDGADRNLFVVIMVAFLLCVLLVIGFLCRKW